MYRRSFILLRGTFARCRQCALEISSRECRVSIIRIAVCICICMRVYIALISASFVYTLAVVSRRVYIQST